MKKGFGKDLVKTIKWAAAEYMYVQRLSGELDQIDSQTTLAKQSREIHKTLSLIGYITNAEHRASAYEQDVFSDLTQLSREMQEYAIDKGHCAQMQQFHAKVRKSLEQLNIERGTLVKYFSRYGGLIANELTEAEAQIQVLEDLKSENPQKAQKIHKHSQDLIQKISQQVKDSKQWVNTLQVTLREIKEIYDLSFKFERSSLRDFFKGPYLGEIISVTSDPFGKTYHYKTRLGVKTDIFIPYRESQDLSAKTIVNLHAILEKCCKRVYSSFFGVVRRPLRKNRYGLYPKLFLDEHGWGCDFFDINGIRYFVKLDKARVSSIDHAKRNIMYSKHLMKRATSFELVDPPYVAATARKNAYGFVVTEARQFSLAHSRARRDLWGDLIDEFKSVKQEHVYKECYKQLVKGQGLTYSDFIHLLIKSRDEILDLLYQVFQHDLDEFTRWGGLDTELAMIFICGYNSRTCKLILSILDQTH